MLRRILLVGLMAGTALLALAPAASAHALVRTSDPPDGAILQRAPSQVVVTFTETPDPSLSVLHVLNQAGQDVEKSATEQVPEQPLVLRVVLGPLPDGVYTVTWRAVSRTDGHVTAGSFSFGVGVAPPTTQHARSVTAPRTPSPSALAVIGRWAFDWGLALLVGGAAFGLVVRPGLPPGGRALMVASWAVAVAGLVLMTAAERSTVGVPLGSLLRSGAGHRFVARGIALVATGAVVILAVFLRRRIWLASVGVAASATMLVHALAGHAGAESGTALRWFDIAMQEAHLVTVGVWIGGLAWLLLSLLGPDRTEPGTTARRFSWLAGLALAAVAVTGAIRAANELGGVHFLHGLFHTSFGIALLVKVGLFAGLVGLGARNRYVHVPAVETGTRRVGSFRRTVGAELLIAAGILGATGVLSELPPASVVAAAASSPVAVQQVIATGSDFATTVRVRLVVTPGFVGPNLFRADVTDFDTGRPVTATAVSLTFSLQGRPELGTPTLTLSKGEGGVWTGRGTVLSMDGRWVVSVLVAKPAGAVTVPLTFETGLPPEQIQVSVVAGQPTIYTITLSGGRTLQTYVDPAKPGNDAVHFTFFQASGDEQSIARATATFTDPSGVTKDMPLIRFDSGHFVANTSLVAGRWRFQIQATLADGQVFTGYFTQPIP